MCLSLFSNEILKVGIFFIISFFLAAIILLLGFLLKPDLGDIEKLSPYECGFEPYDDARGLYDVRFYLIAVLFLVFDLEAVFFFPWCMSFSHLNMEGFFSMIDFIFELIIGYYYAWRTGALEWM